MPKIFEFKLLLVYKLVDMSKIQNKPLLSERRLETESGLMISGLQAEVFFLSKKDIESSKKGIL